MRKVMIGALALAAVVGVVGVLLRATQAQTSPSSAAAPHTTLLALPSDTLDEALLEWPLPPGEQAYGRIDGKHLHRYVEEQAAISRRYRDQGHPKFWGRIIGTSADAESAEWLANKFKAVGMSDVRIQPLGLSPQWFPERWTVTVTGGGKTITLDSAQPDYRAAGCHRAASMSRRYTEVWGAPPISLAKASTARRCSPTRCSARTTKTR